MSKYLSVVGKMPTKAEKAEMRLFPVGYTLIEGEDAS